MTPEPLQTSDPDPDGDLDGALSRADPDRWLSSRFAAGETARRALVAIYAFDNELGRAPRAASTPIVAEMRLAWWREALEEIRSGVPVRRHPVALALSATVGEYSLDLTLLETLIDARFRELDSRPMTLEEALEWAEGTGGTCARLSAAVLDPGCDPQAAAAGGGRLVYRAADPDSGSFGRGGAGGP